MKKQAKKIILSVFLVLTVLAVLTACNMGLPWDVELWGTWTAGDTETIITNTTYSVDNPDSWVWDYSGEVVKYDNFSYNISDENPAEGDYGYMIVKITAHSGDDSQVDTFTVVRWRSLSTSDTGVTTVEYSEAYPAGWATSDEAEAEADAAHFSYFSSMTKSAE